MSWWIKDCILQDNEGYRVFNLECDDVASLPAYNSQSPDFIISRGSKAFVLATSETYCLNSTNQWIKLKDSGGGGSVITLDAEYVGYDNTDSGLTADNVQDAIDELETEIQAITPSGNVQADNVDYDNTDSGLVATNVQDAIDEVQGNVETVETTANSALQPSDVTSTYSALGTDPVNGVAVASALSNSGFITAGTTLAHYGITDAYISSGTITLGSNSITPGTSNFSGAFSDLTGKPTTLSGYGITDAYISGGTITLGNNSLTPGTSNFSGAFTDLTGKPTTLSGYGITDANINNGVITLGSNTITPLTSSDVTSVYNALGTDPVNGIAVAAALAGGGGGGTTIEPFTITFNSTYSSLSNYEKKYIAVCINGCICFISIIISYSGTGNRTTFSGSKFGTIDNSKYFPVSHASNSLPYCGNGSITIFSGGSNTTKLGYPEVYLSSGDININGTGVSSSSTLVRMNAFIVYPIYDIQDGEYVPRS